MFVYTKCKLILLWFFWSVIKSRQRSSQAKALCSIKIGRCCVKVSFWIHCHNYWTCSVKLLKSWLIVLQVDSQKFVLKTNCAVFQFDVAHSLDVILSYVISGRIKCSDGIIQIYLM